MADDFQNYYLQLQQVEAALLSDPNNRELLKLKQDLEEVIALSKDLKSQADGDDYLPNDGGSGGLSDDGDTDPTKTLLTSETKFIQSHGASTSSRKSNTAVKREWKVGDRCLAKWAENSQFYEAVIDSLLPDGQVNVTFLAYQNRSTTTVDELKEIKEKFIDVHGDRNKKHLKLNQREYLKKKKLKKQQRFKELEAEREVEKNKWLAFNTKASKKGVKTKSIFASPDNVNGRVGIGTCGMSGKPMTEFTTAEKWKKN